MFLLLLACSLLEPPAGGPAKSPLEPAAAPSPTASSPDVLTHLRGQPLVTTRHGECRMACRHIDRDEVAHLLATGTLVPERSRSDGECPSHALEGTTPDGQHARLVVAACPGETRVVTVIDLDTDWECTCD